MFLGQHRACNCGFCAVKNSHIAPLTRMIHQVHENISPVPAKSGLVLGLGETANKILTMLKKLRSVHCHMLTIGQYLQPVYAHFPAHQFVIPRVYEAWRRTSPQLGFAVVAGGSLIRSSYNARKLSRKKNAHF